MREDGQDGRRILKPVNERRLLQRKMCSEFVEVFFRDQTGLGVTETGLLEDLSRTGLCVSLAVPVTVGEIVSFTCEGFEGSGEVRYCNLGEYGYLLGVRFGDGLEWDERQWKPRHLLSLPMDAR